MRAVVVYKDDSEHSRPVTEFLRFYRQVTGRDLETLEPETREGIGFCSTYDIMVYPTVIALSDDGQVLNKWAGLPLPTVNEVSFYG